ncbi:unnamed protein product, partial [Mesorhabditis spiculigera]
MQLLRFLRYSSTNALAQGSLSSLLHFHNAEKWPKYMKELIDKNVTVTRDFITPDEESELLREIEPHMKRLRYEKSHWDDAIHLYREREQRKWSPQNENVIRRIRESSFPADTQHLTYVHILDLHKDGVIKPHIDSIRYCGDVITGVSLLSDCVMRLRHKDDKSVKVVDLLLERRSLYRLGDLGRYDFTHEILEEEDSEFNGVKVPRDRRISLICRDLPKPGNELQEGEVEKQTEIVQNDHFTFALTMPAITLKSGRELVTVDEEQLNKNLRAGGFSKVLDSEEFAGKDLISNVYEGGLKVWECSTNLCDYMEEHAAVFSGASVLELGCGAAFPAILAAKLGAREVIAQDYNDYVTKCFSEGCFAANEVPTKNVKFLACDWAKIPEFLPSKSIDVIMTSETIYNTLNYPSLIEAFAHCLAPEGTVLIAAKEYYFGLGGSVPGFLEEVDKSGLFSHEIVWRSPFQSGYQKQIVELKRR